MNCRGVNLLRAGLLTGLALQPQALRACAACYGQSDSPMAEGMNWGILTLLAVVVCVLSAIASFFVYLGRRSAEFPAETEPPPSSASTPTEGDGRWND